MRSLFLSHYDNSQNRCAFIDVRRHPAAATAEKGALLQESLRHQPRPTNPVGRGWCSFFPTTPVELALALQSQRAIMCGRYTLHHSAQEVAQRFAVEETLFKFPVRYNIAPMQAMAVVTRNAHGDDKRLLEGYRWGLVPSWAKDDAIGSKMINARGETLAEKPSFKSALRSRRCLIPADGFYEWKTVGRTKQPHYIRFNDDRIYAFAGLWDEWNGPGDAPLRTATIITGEPNPLLAKLHHRMAVILKPSDEAIWLDPKVSAADALQLLQCYPDDEMEAFPVDRKVGNVAFDDAICIAPLPAELAAESEQLSLL